jgi:hypothetical protein
MIHFNSMLVLKEPFRSYHSPSSTRIIVDGRELDLAQELLVGAIKLRCDLRAGNTGRQRFGERNDIPICPESLIAVECWCRCRMRFIEGQRVFGEGGGAKDVGEGDSTVYFGE